ncbi:UNVERIFIED_CONTAM: putative plastid-lipid-associated protein 10, chloroplastic, partial [Sesamum angustifolium]
MEAASSLSLSLSLSLSTAPFLYCPFFPEENLLCLFNQNPDFIILHYVGPPPPPLFQLLPGVSSSVQESEIELENRKFELLRAVTDTQRGLTATADQRSSIEEALILQFIKSFKAQVPVSTSR